MKTNQLNFSLLCNVEDERAFTLVCPRCGAEQTLSYSNGDRSAVISCPNERCEHIFSNVELAQSEAYSRSGLLGQIVED